MKTITLVRHATAVARDESKPDFPRKLKKKGVKESQNIARRVLKLGGAPDLIHSSAAPRALETAQIFASILDMNSDEIVKNNELYEMADPNALLAYIRQIDNEINDVMLFGHDPLFSDFAQMFVPGFEAFLPKCSALRISTRRKTWHNLQAGDGTVEYFETPVKMPEKSDVEKAIRKDLEAQLRAVIRTVMGDFNIDPKKAAQDIARASKDLAKNYGAHAKVDYYDYFVENMKSED